MAVASFVTAVSAVALGWIPFVFVIAAAAAIAAAVFGIIGVRTARRYDGYGRGFAVAGLALSPVALAVCVGGFFFTKALVREFRHFVEPGPHQLVVDQSCVLDGGRATLHGTISNLDDHNRTYRIFVDFSDDNDTKLVTVAVTDVGPGDQAEWSASAEIDGTSVECTVTDVFGPLPFDIDPDD